MRTLLVTMLVVGMMAIGLMVPSMRPVSAADGYCFCTVSLDYIKPGVSLQTEDSYWQSGCVKVATDDCEVVRTSVSHEYETCVGPALSQVACQDQKKIFDTNYAKRLQDAKQGGLTAGTSKFIPDCALQDELTAECKDIGIFVILGINVANYLFSIIGALALLMFIYGGFILILSQGSAEQVQKGKDAMVAAIIGLVVAFSGYALIQFAGQAIGLSAGFGL